MKRLEPARSRGNDARETALGSANLRRHDVGGTVRHASITDFLQFLMNFLRRNPPRHRPDPCLAAGRPHLRRRRLRPGPAIRNPWKWLDGLCAFRVQVLILGEALGSSREPTIRPEIPGCPARRRRSAREDADVRSMARSPGLLDRVGVPRIRIGFAGAAGLTGRVHDGRRAGPGMIRRAARPPPRNEPPQPGDDGWPERPPYSRPSA